MTRKLSLLIFFLGLAGCVALASPSEYTRIARLSYQEGHVSFQHPDEVDWTAASVNMALQPQDRIYTGDDGRAQIEFDDGSVMYLAEKTDVEVLSLQDDLIQIRVLVGLCSLSARGSVNFEIDTPAAAFSTLKKGIYRFDVADDGASDAIVRKGRLEGANNGFTRRIESGELLHVTPGDRGTQQVSRYENRDAWDEWTDRRNADMMAYDSRRYIPDNVYMGVSELDRYGHWMAVDSYGPAWVPYYVDAGWSPYWAGRWCYRPFWGWTWVSYEPWGWLPYHYGRWYHAGFGWCWLPGPSFGFNFWSPGLVRFYNGPSWVSWAPLGPGDYYNVNHYHYNPIYAHQLNNLRMIQNRAPDDLVNRNVPGAFRTVTTQTFVSSSLGGNGRVAPIESISQPWRQGRMITDRLPVQPSTSSFAPAPDRPAVRPTMERSLPAIVRTMPASGEAGRNRYVRIGDPAGTASSGSRSETRSLPAANEGPGRGAPTGGARNVAGSSSSGSPTPGIWNRRTDQSRQDATSRGGVNQTTVPSGSREAGGSGSGREVQGNRAVGPGSPAQGREMTPAKPSVIERPRTGDRATPRPNTPRTEPAPAPRYERPAPAPRPDVERSRPQERTRPSKPQSSSYEPRSYEPRSYETRSAWGGNNGRPAVTESAPQPVQRYEGSAPRPAPPASWGSGRSGSYGGEGRAVHSAPAAPSSSWRGSGSGSFGGGGGRTIQSAPARSAPSGGGISRPRGR